MNSFYSRHFSILSIDLESWEAIKYGFSFLISTQYFKKGEHKADIQKEMD